jgi:predicted kinase
MASAALDENVMLQGFWLDAPDAVLVERLRLRQRDPSDADAGVLVKQRRTLVGDLTWTRIDAEYSTMVEKIRSKICCNDEFPAN